MPVTIHPPARNGPATLRRSRPGSPMPAVDILRRAGARTVQVAPGSFHSGALTGDPEGWLGLLILDGLMQAEAMVGRAHVGWLVGAEDLIRPWQMGEVCLTEHVMWRALSRCRVMLLDRTVAQQLARLPRLTDTIVGWAARTTQWLMAGSLVVSSPVVEERLLLLFALLGERWGKATAEGVSIELPLTHIVLAKLCGTRRPTVTGALRSLELEGLLERRSAGDWLLKRVDRATLSPLPSCWTEYAAALGLE
jgi:CRP-like cAMP-binding protein